MSNFEALHELYEQCRKINYDEISDVVQKAQSEEEQNFFSLVTDYFLQERQKTVIAENRF